MTHSRVQVREGKATELNFTLAPVVSEGADGITVTTTTSMPSTSHLNVFNSTQTTVVPSEGGSTPSLPPEHQTIQPQEFRHHNYADMEIFLRKYNSEFPTITHLYSAGRSKEDRELYVMVISDNPTVHEHGIT